MNWQARLLRRLGVPLRPFPARQVLSLRRWPHLFGAATPQAGFACGACGAPAAGWVSYPLVEQGFYCARCAPTGAVRPRWTVPTEHHAAS